MGFLQKLLGGREAQFQRQTLEVLRKEYPDVDLQPGGSAQQIRMTAVELDLHVLSETCRRNETQADDFIRRYFAFPAAMTRRVSASWNEIVSRVRPQLVPNEFAERFGILTVPFAGGISTAVVVKQEGSHPFVRREDAAAWGVAAEELFRRSIDNLNEDPVEMEVTITEGTDRFIGMEGGDGFDAARILLPRVRQFAEEKLGSPYLAGIPNRDFLILWSTGCSQRFQDYAVEKIETDFNIQPFALTTAIFRVSAGAVEPVIK